MSVLKGLASVAITVVVGKLMKTHVIDKPSMTYSKEEYERAERKLVGVRRELRRTRRALVEIYGSTNKDAFTEIYKLQHKSYYEPIDDIYKKTKLQEEKLIKEESQYEEIIKIYKSELDVLNKYNRKHRFF